MQSTSHTHWSDALEQQHRVTFALREGKYALGNSRLISIGSQQVVQTWQGGGRSHSPPHTHDQQSAVRGTHHCGQASSETIFCGRRAESDGLTHPSLGVAVSCCYGYYSSHVRSWQAMEGTETEGGVLSDHCTLHLWGREEEGHRSQSGVCETRDGQGSGRRQ